MVFQDPVLLAEPADDRGRDAARAAAGAPRVPANRVATFSAELLALVGLSEADLSSTRASSPAASDSGWRSPGPSRCVPTSCRDEPVSALDVSVQASTQPAADLRANSGSRSSDIPRSRSSAAHLRPGRRHVPGPHRRGSRPPSRISARPATVYLRAPTTTYCWANEKTREFVAVHRPDHGPPAQRGAGLGASSPRTPHSAGPWRPPGMEDGLAAAADVIDVHIQALSWMVEDGPAAVLEGGPVRPPRLTPGRRPRGVERRAPGALR